METNWTIPTSDGHKIYGVKNASSEKQAKQAIFIVHGLTGHINEYALKRAAEYFSPEYDVYRFSLYVGEEGARSLVDCTIQTHADDLNAVLDAFADSYEKVFLIGHSYGGATVMMANPEKITSVSLWDPSFNLNDIQQEFIPIGDHYIYGSGVSSLLGKDMYEEAGRLDGDACVKLAQDFKHPVQVVHAANGWYIKRGDSYHSFNKNSRYDVVEGTVHCFYEGNTCDDLLQKTESWFKQF